MKFFISFILCHTWKVALSEHVHFVYFNEVHINDVPLLPDFCCIIRNTQENPYKDAVIDSVTFELIALWICEISFV